MLENLYKTKKEVLAKYEALNNKMKVEKRSVFNSDEMVEANNLKIELADLNKQIEIEKEMEAERKSAAESTFNVPNVIVKDSKSDELDIVKETEKEFKSFMENVRSNKSSNIVLTPEYLVSKYATTSTSTNAGFVQTSHLPGISVQEPDLVLAKAGAQSLFFADNTGNQRVNSLTHIKGSFVSEGGSISNKDLSSAYADLSPEYIAVPLKLSRKFFQSISKANLDGIINHAVIGIEKGKEDRAFRAMTGLTVVTGGTMWQAVLAAESAVLGAGSAYVLDAKGTAKAKDNMRGSSSTTNIWANDAVINGYAAYRSGVLGSIVENKAFYGKFADVAMAQWGGIKIEYIFDSALALTGEIMINVSTEADAKVLNSASLVQFSTASF